MTYRVDVETDEGKVSVEKDTPVGAIEVAMSCADKGNINLSISDTSDGLVYPFREMDKLLRKTLGVE